VKETGATNCILVTDGAEDEYVIPIIQSRIPVSSIRRVIVNQMPNLEGTYYILKKLLDDPKISRMIFIPLGLAMLLYAAAYLFNAPGIATIIVIGVIGSYMLYKGFGFDEIFHGIIDTLRVSLQRGRFSFVTYTITILLVLMGILFGFLTILQYYSADFGLIYYLMLFVYGSIGWLIAGGLVMSIGIIVDVNANEQQGLAKVIVFPFFITAVGLILYCASLFLLPVGDILHFPLTPDQAASQVVYFAIAGIISAISGVLIQFFINRKQAERRKKEIIEVL
jgi:putative membrane protein